MLVEDYPVGWALDARETEPVLAYLIDLPAIARRGRSLTEALSKLEGVAPAILATYRREGTVLPQPSPQPNLRIGGVRWSVNSRVEAGASAGQLFEERTTIQLSPA